jgi:hypothetical protein
MECSFIHGPQSGHQPPASSFLFDGVEPALRIGFEVVVEPMTALIMGRRVDDAGDMPARSQFKLRFVPD